MADARVLQSGLAEEWARAVTEAWEVKGTVAAGAAGQAWFRNGTEMLSELTDFAHLRLQETLRTQADIQRCTNPMELRDVQCRYLKTAFEQYCVEAGRLMQLNQNALDAFLGKGADG